MKADVSDSYLEAIDRLQRIRFVVKFFFWLSLLCLALKMLTCFRVVFCKVSPFPDYYTIRYGVCTRKLTGQDLPV